MGIEDVTVLSCQASQFELPKNVIYLNCAYQSPLSIEVQNAGINGVRQKGRPFEIGVTDFFEPLSVLKDLYAQLIDLKDSERIAFHPSVSYGISIIAKNLPLKKGGNIVMPGDQFPSNYYAIEAWTKRNNVALRLIGPGDGFENRGQVWNDRLLNAIDDQTIAVITDHVHWGDGTIFNLDKIRKKSRNHGALLIIDGTQSIGAFPLSIEKIKPDAVVCAGYKFLMGPYGCALTYFGDFFDHGEPIEYNWMNRLHSEDFSNLTNYRAEYRPKAFRYNVGECANFIMIPMLTAAIKQILNWGVENIQEYCKEIGSEFRENLRSKNYLVDDEYSAAHLFGVYKEKGSIGNVFVDALKGKSIFISSRNGAIRVSPHVYNHKQHFDRLFNEL